MKTNNRFTKLKKNRLGKGTTLSPLAADQMLQNVFTVVGTSSNAVPLAVIEDYANYKKERFITIRSILVIVIILLLLSPLLFVRGNYSVVDKTGEAQSPVYEIHVTGIFPVQVSATQNGLHLPVYDAGIRTFSIEPTKNGMMDICITFFNQQEIHHTIMVTQMDTTAPSFISSQVSNKSVYLYVSDSESGIDYESIYAKDAAGDIISPVSYDVEDGLVVFESPASSINVHIPDMAGNELLLVLTPNN